MTGSIVRGMERSLMSETSLRGLTGNLSLAREVVREPALGLTLATFTRASPGTPLAPEFRRRIDALGDRPLDTRARRAAFSEVVETFSLDGFGLVMVNDVCSCEPADHRLSMGGRLYRWDRLAATWHREFILDHGVVLHHYLSVEPPFRKAGLAPGILARGLELYDRLGLSHIVLKTGLESGSYHWARCGFDFLTPGDRLRVVTFFDAVVQRLGLPLDTSGFGSATQFALADPSVTTSMAAIASLLGVDAGRVLRERAAKNGIDFYGQIPAGKAIMLCGPDWQGVLPLTGPARTTFDAYIQSRLRRVARAAQRISEGS